MNRHSIRFVFAASAIALLGAAPSSRADDAKAFIDQHLSDVVKIESHQIDAPAVTKVFGTPIYTMTVNIFDGEGSSQSSSLVVAKTDTKLLPLLRPGTDGDYPAIQKLFNPRFKLAGDTDAATVQEALDLVFPFFTDQEKAARAFRHSGNRWTFVRGTAFDKKMGFVLTTDGSGAIIGVKYVLELP
jgi:hypothetical protein